MQTIYKYKFAVADEVSIRMPAGARLLSVQAQNGIPSLWAMVDINAETVTRRLAVRGAGHSCEGLSEATFVGTFQLVMGAFVGHLFDLGER